MHDYDVMDFVSCCGYCGDVIDYCLGPVSYTHLTLPTILRV